MYYRHAAAFILITTIMIFSAGTISAERKQAKAPFYSMSLVNWIPDEGLVSLKFYDRKGAQIAFKGNVYILQAPYLREIYQKCKAQKAGGGKKHHLKPSMMKKDGSYDIWITPYPEPSPVEEGNDKLNEKDEEKVTPKAKKNTGVVLAVYYRGKYLVQYICKQRGGPDPFDFILKKKNMSK